MIHNFKFRNYSLGAFERFCLLIPWQFLQIPYSKCVIKLKYYVLFTCLIILVTVYRYCYNYTTILF